MLRELEQTRKTNQGAADQIAGDLYQDTSVVLARQGVPKRQAVNAILQGIAGDRGFFDQRFLSMYELLSIRVLTKEVDFGDDGVKSVTLRGYGWDKKKNQPHRTFVSVSGFPHFIEFRKDHAVMWDVSTRGRRAFSHRGGKADIQEVNFYKEVVSKLG